MDTSELTTCLRMEGGFNMYGRYKRRHSNYLNNNPDTIFEQTVQLDNLLTNISNVKCTNHFTATIMEEKKSYPKRCLPVISDIDKPTSFVNCVST